MRITSANIHFNEQGTPVAGNFDDVYYSNDDGLAESTHVFIDGNNLLARWSAHKDSHFCIAETGFGTGLNCLLTLAAFSKFREENPQHPLRNLHLITNEKFPLEKDDAAKALASHTSLLPWTKHLIENYPTHLSGVHRITFPYGTLDIWLGDVEDTMAQWDCPSAGLVDAWFLDGFAPSKNPDMWQQSLFSQMAKMSKHHATLATFTAAGFVRRGLIEAGFTMRKQAGFGRKREMLVGELHNASKISSAKNPIKHVAIVGAGLAGANAAYSFAKRGFEISLFTESELASGASGNAQGGFYPQLHAIDSYASRIQAHSFLFASNLYHTLLKQGFHFDHDWCGVLQLAFSEKALERQTKLIENNLWPESLVIPLEPDAATQKAGLGIPCSGLFFEKGGWISPPQLVAALIQAAEQTSNITIYKNEKVLKLTATESDVELTTSTGDFCFDHLILATGHESALLDSVTSLPFRRVRGQVEAVATTQTLNKLQCVLCHKGYFTPTLNQRHAMGSTYVRQDINTEYRPEESLLNLETHKKALAQTDWIEEVTLDNNGRASIRMGLPDHQPVVGKVDVSSAFNRISVLTGLGSRGLTTAPLMAELLASELENEPLPLSTELVRAVNVNRFNK